MDNLAKRIATVYRDLYRTDDFIPLHAPIFTDEDANVVANCVKSGWVSSVGQYVTQFQDEIAKFVGSEGAVATVNGTAALHLALVALGVDASCEVLVPDLTFVATAAACKYTGADIVFLDSEESTLSLCPQSLQRYLEQETEVINGVCYSKLTRKHVAACVPMHNVGFPADIWAIVDICKRHHVAVIEDAAEALGSHIDGKYCGTFGDVGVFSFNGNKILTTGGGGAVVAKSPDVLQKILHLSTTAKIPHPYRYAHDDVGYNYRLPNLNAALGWNQMRRFPATLQKKKEQFNAIYEQLSQQGPLSIKTSALGVCNEWFVVAKVDCDVDAFIQSLAKVNIMSRPLWSCLSDMVPYANCRVFENQNAQKIAKTYVCLPNGLVGNVAS